MSRIIEFVFLTFLVRSILVPQTYRPSPFDAGPIKVDYHPPSPIIGWDSLQSQIIYPYPYLYGRLGVSSALECILEIDSTGAILHDTIKTMFGGRLTEDDLHFANSLRRAIRQTKWNAATLGSKPVSRTVRIPVLYFVDQEDAAPLLIKRLQTDFWDRVIK